MTVRATVLGLALVLSASEQASTAQPPVRGLRDAVTADARHYSIEFENDVVRVLRVRLGAGERAPAHTHPAYCAIEISDSSLREGAGAVSESKAGQVFCGDALSHGPTNVGQALAESIVVEFENRQRARWTRLALRRPRSAQHGAHGVVPLAARVLVEPGSGHFAIEISSMSNTSVPYGARRPR
jgi:hypothetical protein